MHSRYKGAGLGRLLYHVYHAPLGRIRNSIREGGPIEQWRTSKGRTAMEEAAGNLPALPKYPGSALELNLLTGRKYWYQTAFCLWSFARASRRELAPVIFDDGSLAEEHRQRIVQVFPRTRFVGAGEIAANLEHVLPLSRYPTLRARRADFVLLRKITDIHAGRTGWHLFIDSDLLFFHSPSLLLEWLASPHAPLRATDVQNAYGYPLALLNELAGRTVEERVNTGLLGLDSGAMDWDRMEYWCRTLIARAGPHYYQEQALVALLLAGRECIVAPISDYVTMPCLPEALECKAIMHHYVAESKRWYFQHNWRRVMDPDLLRARPE